MRNIYLKAGIFKIRRNCRLGFSNNGNTTKDMALRHAKRVNAHGTSITLKKVN